MIYDINGIQLNRAYLHNGLAVTNAYDVDGNAIFGGDIPDDPYLPNRLLLFEDNFGGENLDENTWQCEIGRVRGGEYSTSRPGIFRSQNVTLEDGKLVLTARKENHLGYTWTMGSIASAHRRSWMYGRYDAKIKTPGISGAFPAYWCVGGSAFQTYADDNGIREYTTQAEGSNATRWPLCGEIDITEGTPGNTPTPPCNMWDADGNGMGAGFPASINPNEWHIYSMEWTSQYIAMLLDGVEYKRWTFSDYTEAQINAYKSEPQCIILNLDVGGAGGTIGSQIEMKMYVDWVRVYAPTGIITPIRDTAITMPQTLRLKKQYRTYIVPHFTPITTSDQSITWTSSDETIARVDHGLIYGVDYGTAIITAVSANGNMATCTVTVVDTL